MEAKRKGTWKTALLVGCIGVVIIVAGLAAVVATNWGRLSSLYSQAANTFAALRSVQATLQDRYRTQVSVQTKRHSGVTGSILSVNLINPSFLKDFDPNGRDGRRKALEIAATARDALPVGGGYENYEVIFTQQQGFGVTFSRTHHFMFRANDLPPPDRH